MSLFPGVAAKSQYLLEFKAGRMKRDGKLVSPDVRKGLIAVHQGDDSLMHFIWKDRKTNRTDDDSDLIIFPEEAELKKVKQTAQRVYQLVFKGSNKRFFFWMQEPKDDKDAELCRKVNWLLNNPPAPGASGDPFAGMSMDYANGAMEEDKKETESNDSDRPTDAAATAPAGGQATAAEIALLQQFLKGIKMPDNVELQQVLSPEAIAPLLDNDEVLERLKPFLPPPHTSSAINQLVRSPQFAQAVQAFNAALKSGDISTQALGVDSESKTVAGVEAFLKALQSEADNKKKEVGEDTPADTEKMEE